MHPVYQVDDMEKVNSNAPYIIVDNQKLYPVDRSPDLESKDIDTMEDNPFGIIDRVTISNEARKRSKVIKAGDVKA